MFDQELQAYRQGRHTNHRRGRLVGRKVILIVRKGRLTRWAQRHESHTQSGGGSSPLSSQ